MLTPRWPTPALPSKRQGGGDRVLDWERQARAWLSSRRASNSRTAILGADPAELDQVDDHRVQMPSVYPGGRAGEPVAQFPLAIAFPPTSPTYLHGDPAAYLAQRGIGQLHEVRMLDDHRGARQRVVHRGHA